MILRLIIRGTILVFILQLAFSSCHKKNTEFDYNQAVETVHDYVEAQQMTNLLLATYFKAISDSILLVDSIATIDGAEVTLTSNPPTIKFNYFNGEIKDGFGHMRIGKYEASTTTNFTIPQAEISFDLTSLFYDGDHLSSEEFVLTNNMVSHIYDINVVGLERTNADTSGTIYFNCQQSIELIKGSFSPYHTNNDYFSIYGNATGTAINGNSFIAQTQESDQMLLYYTCSWMLGGESAVELPELIHNATVSFFNDETCINKYTVIINEALFEKTYDSKF